MTLKFACPTCGYEQLGWLVRCPICGTRQASIGAASSSEVPDLSALSEQNSVFTGAELERLKFLRWRRDREEIEA